MVLSASHQIETIRTTMTAEEYLVFAREVAAARDEQYEYLDGELIPMVGASRRHQRIVSNLLAYLYDHLSNRGWQVYTSASQVRIEAANAYYFPDVVIAPDGDDTDEFTLFNPVFIAEVLSPGTERRDRTLKLSHYQTVPTIGDILLIAQDKRRVEHYRREVGGWSAIVHVGSGDLALVSVDVPLGLDLIYRQVNISDQ